MRNPVGTHVLVGKGLVAGALARRRGLGCEAIQMFAGNPRGWAARPGDPPRTPGSGGERAERGMRRSSTRRTS